MSKTTLSFAIISLLVALSGSAVAHHIEPEVHEWSQKMSDKVEDILISSDRSISERMIELYDIRDAAKNLQAKYADHPDTAGFAKGVSEEANEAWQRLYDQRIAEEEAAEKEKKRALALGANANVTIAQTKTFFIFYRLAEYCAEQDIVFSADEAAQLQSNIKDSLDKDGIPKKMRDEAWEAVEVGWASANIEHRSQYELKVECNQVRETVMASGLLKPIPTRRKNPF